MSTAMTTPSSPPKVGDEVRCVVERVEELEKLSYEEEDEEGAMVEVEIQPGWLAR